MPHVSLSLSLSPSLSLTLGSLISNELKNRKSAFVLNITKALIYEKNIRSQNLNLRKKKEFYLFSMVLK